MSRTSEVSAQTGKLVVTSASPVDDDAVLAAVDEAGYKAVRTSWTPQPD